MPTTRPDGEAAMVAVEVEAGICGFTTRCGVACEDGQNVSFRVESDCPKIRKLAAALSAAGPVDAFREMSPSGPSVVLGAGGAPSGCCLGCVVPAGLALPRDVRITLTRR